MKTLPRVWTILTIVSFYFLGVVAVVSTRSDIQIILAVLCFGFGSLLTTMIFISDQIGVIFKRLNVRGVDDKIDQYHQYSRPEVRANSSQLSRDYVVTDLWDDPSGGYVALLLDQKVVAAIDGKYFTFDNISEWRERTGIKEQLVESDKLRKQQFYSGIGSELGLRAIKPLW